MNHPVSKIINADCLEAMRSMEDNSIDSIVTDPPYGLCFMGKKWDYDVPSVEVWKECLRILKPGGHLLAFAGTRTQHRMAVRIEDAGFEIRDMIAWVYGSGFPKSLNIGKAVDKLQGNDREVVGEYKVSSDFNEHKGSMMSVENSGEKNKSTILEFTKGKSEWEGWGTALKPALEPITVARKPIQGTVADNVLNHGTGGINIDACRVGKDKRIQLSGQAMKPGKSTFVGLHQSERPIGYLQTVQGRFPANFIHDGSDEVLQMFPSANKNGKLTIGGTPRKNGGHILNGSPDRTNSIMSFGDSGTAARFFYCAKASKSERDFGLNDLKINQTTGGGGGIGDYLNDVNSASGKYGSEKAPAKNNHPTVKPISLMRYLCRLVTPLTGIILDPFMGSGTTLLAAYDEGFNCIGIEKDSQYAKIAEARLKAHIAQLKLELI
jgi:DNA modification methylase